MRWYLQNAYARAAFVLRNPRYSLRAILREVQNADEKFLAATTGRGAAEIRAFFNEPANLAWFVQHLGSCEEELNRPVVESANLYAKKVLVQYATVRALRPKVVLETGIAGGVSTTYLLLALDRNGDGVLHSVGDQNPAFLPPGRRPGWIVPEKLASRWTLHLGKAEDLLPNLAQHLSPIDIFIHDSLHTHEHMLFEFRTAYPRLRPGGLLLSDDVLWNSAFAQFCGEVPTSAAQVLRGVGVLKKPLE
jgi:predicted O-methyltransferase YrrM